MCSCAAQCLIIRPQDYDASFVAYARASTRQPSLVRVSRNPDATYHFRNTIKGKILVLFASLTVSDSLMRLVAGFPRLHNNLDTKRRLVGGGSGPLHEESNLGVMLCQGDY